MSCKTMYYYLLKWAVRLLKRSEEATVDYRRYNENHKYLRHPDYVVAVVVFAILLSPPIAVIVGAELINVSDRVAWVVLALVGSDMLISSILSLITYFRKRHS